VKNLKAADLFCGAGGTTEGARRSGVVDVVLAINHWQIAIQSHSANHPDTRHVCADIDHVNPRDYRDMGIDVLLASPECVFHSHARGGKPVDDQRRATAWCVPRWAEEIRPKWIVVENVREFEQWAPLGVDNRPLKSRKGEIFQAWVAAIRALNYHVEWKLLNAADYGAATKRIRLFVVARRGASTQPIPWPVISHPRERWTPASEIIDWSIPCPSIFTRKRPLAEKTLRRIEIGLRKFCGPDAKPFIVKLRGTNNASPIGEPLPTITAGGKHAALAQPFLVGAGGPIYAAKPRSVREPLNTVICQNHVGLVAPFQLQLIGRGAGRVKSINEPIPTVIASRENHGIVAPFIVPHFGERDGQVPRSHSIAEPLPTVTGQGAGSVVLPFLTEFYGTGGARSVAEPLSTVTTKHRHGLVLLMQELGIVDIGFRMLEPVELAAAQGFPRDYRLFGNKSDQIKQIGNSVCTAVAEAICSSIGLAA
jgi:DNA (cytosine-5)-methyltransferase 1